MNKKKKSYICVQCGNCCRWQGPVWLTEEEVTTLARFFKISDIEFKKKYTRHLYNRKNISLTEKDDGSCVLLNGNKCTVHKIKPKQCRNFPNEWNFPGFEELCNAKQDEN